MTLTRPRTWPRQGAAASPEDLYNLGEVAFGEGNVDVAAEWYEKSVAADPEWEPPVFKLALVALNRGDIEGAKVLFQKVLGPGPELAGRGTSPGNARGTPLGHLFPHPAKIRPDRSM